MAYYERNISFIFSHIQQISTSGFAPKMSHAKKAMNKERIEIHSWLRRAIVGLIGQSRDVLLLTSNVLT